MAVGRKQSAENGDVLPANCQLLSANCTHAAFGLGGGGSNTGTSVTYNLGANPLGYNISAIVVYGGWNDNGRDQQLYTVSYSLIGDAGFIALPTVNFNPAVGANLQTANRSTTRNKNANNSWGRWC